MTNRIEEIIALEWKLFDKVQNVGGRASCQDNWKEFHIMRSSQLEAWSEAMCDSYYEDLLTADLQGRNPLAEKYGYMMERTNPLEFARIKDQLPPRTAEKDTIIERLCAVHVGWLEAMAQCYPHLAGRGRPIHRSEDTPYATSFETYLWGELATYSLKTLQQYDAYVQQLEAQGKNMNLMVLENTTKQYGYASLEEAEQALAKQ